MDFTVNIHTDNEAFSPDPSYEIVRLLREIADRIEAGDHYYTFRTIHDANGNDVGRFALKPVVPA